MNWSVILIKENNVIELLKYIEENGIIDLTYVQEQVQMKRREEILKRHHYTIWHSEKEDVWYTYLPDNSKANNRKKIKRKSKRDLEDIIYDYYLSVQSEQVEMRSKDLSIENMFYEFMKHKAKEVNGGTIKRMMTGVLTAALVMAPAMSVGATTVTGSSASAAEEVVASSTSGEVTAVAEVPTTSVVAGVKTTTAGVYLATSVNGSVVTTGVAAIAEGYGLTGSERPYAKFFNLDAKKSNLAASAINAAAEAKGAVVGPMLNIELGKMSAGKYSLLPSDGAAIRLSLGVPKNFAQTGATYAVVCVRPGGAVTILEDLDTNPNTVTFDTTGGAGAYAMIKY